MALVLDAFAGSWDTAGMTLSYQRLFRETDSRPITSIVRQCQLRRYGQVARYPKADPAYRVVSERDNPAWRRPREHPQNSWLCQVDASYWELLNMGREPAWRLARRDRQGWRCRVGEARTNTYKVRQIGEVAEGG